MMEIHAPHIGEAIKRRVKEKGISIEDFADAICCSRRNVYRIFKRNYIDTQRLKCISRALDFDFSDHIIETNTLITRYIVIVKADEDELHEIVSKFQVVSSFEV